MSEKRASTPEEMEARRQELRDVLKGLLTEMPFSSVTISGISRRTSWSRSNIYRYYRNVDEIGYELCVAEIVDMGRGIVRCIGRDRGRPMEDLARDVADFIVGYEGMPMITRLYPIVSTRDLRPEVAARGRAALDAINAEYYGAIAGATGLDEASAAAVARNIWYHYFGVFAILDVNGAYPAGDALVRPDAETYREDIRRNVLMYLTGFDGRTG